MMMVKGDGKMMFGTDEDDVARIVPTLLPSFQVKHLTLHARCKLKEQREESLVYLLVGVYCCLERG